MPKLRKILLQYAGAPVEHELWYNTKSKAFEIRGLPRDFTEKTGVRSSGYLTEKDLLASLQDACKKYRELNTNSKKVIRYQCSASAILIMHVTDHRNGGTSYSGRLPGVSEKIASSHYGDGCGFTIDFNCYQVVDDGVKRKYFDYYPDTKETGSWSREFSNSRGEGWTEIPFTAERWKFFQGLELAMKEMVKRMSKFFDADAEQAAALIDSKIKLLQA